MLGISVLICSYNGGNFIKDTLGYLQKQTFTDPIDWEVILVDNASTDDLVQVARQSWKASVPLQILSEARPGVGYARQTGIRAARYSYVIFVDDDNHLAADYLQTAFDLMRAYPQAGAIGGLNDAVFEAPPPAWYATYQANFAVGPQSPAEGEVTHENRVLWGAGLVLRKSAWEQLDAAGFKPMLPSRTGNQLLSGDDSELCYMLRLFGWKLYYFSSLRLGHVMPEERLRWSYLCRLKRALGATSLYLAMIRRCYHAAITSEAAANQSWFRGFGDDLVSILREPHVLAATVLGLFEGNYRILLMHARLGRTAEYLRVRKRHEQIEQALSRQFTQWSHSLNQFNTEEMIDKEKL
jgi:glycosyltransferase involved in cell wall biosynthesis